MFPIALVLVLTLVFSLGVFICVTSDLATRARTGYALRKNCRCSPSSGTTA